MVLEEIVLDLKIYKRLWGKPNKGINMNLLTYHRPTREYIGNVGPFGIFRYYILGQAWRCSISKNLQLRVVLNLLDFTAKIISPHIGLTRKTMEPLSYTLKILESITSTVWIRK